MNILSKKGLSKRFMAMILSISMFFMALPVIINASADGIDGYLSLNWYKLPHGVVSEESNDFVIKYSFSNNESAYELTGNRMYLFEYYDEGNFNTVISD